MSDRMLLAEAIWQRPKYAIDWKSDFDPFTDANDCNAIIKHLNGLDYTPVITHHRNKTASIVLLHIDRECLEWMGDNWMHGVCELAATVLKRQDTQSGYKHTQSGDVAPDDPGHD